MNDSLGMMIARINVLLTSFVARFALVRQVDGVNDFTPAQGCKVRAK
jgi:hypothetical protein